VKFYVVQDDYVKHLQVIDNRVPDNDGGDRTYVGIILEVGNFKYLAPLTSPKPHHQSLTRSDLRFFKLHEKGNAKNELGMLRLCNMIPLADGAYHLLDMDAQEPRYKRLLINQIHFIVSNQDAIKERAKLLYDLVISAKNAELLEHSCDFHGLEKGCEVYAQRITKAAIADKKSTGMGISQSAAKTVSKTPRPMLTLKPKPQGETEI
jgi:protein AbiQ